MAGTDNANGNNDDNNIIFNNIIKNNIFIIIVVTLSAKHNQKLSKLFAIDLKGQFTG